MKSFVRIVIILICILTWSDSYCQQYGLGFYGNEVVSDHRTSLILGNSEKICPKESYTLSFQLKFRPNVAGDFGYVFRMIDSQKNNFDLVYNGQFQFIYKDQKLELDFAIDSAKLRNQWNDFKIHFDEDIWVEINGKAVKKSKSGLPNKFTCFKIYFGACDFKSLETKDVLPVNIKDIRISVGNTLLHAWDLRVLKGNLVKDQITGNTDFAVNPNWIYNDYYSWRLINEFNSKGAVGVTSDEMAQNLIFTGSPKSFNYEVKSGVFNERPTENINLVLGDMSLHLKSSENSGIMRLNEKQVFILDKTNPVVPNTDKVTEYWQHNLYVYPMDTAVVGIAGYGMYKYKNSFQKYSFITQKWSDIKFTGDIPDPRYLAGFGSVANRTKSYLIGGYGSSTGDQLLKPGNYYDMFEIDWIENKIVRKYELPLSDSPYVFAKDLIINPKNETFYGFTFNQINFNSSLQLIQGSLNKPEFEKFALPIPFNFQDTRTEVRLFYNDIQKELLCVILEFNQDNNSTDVKIYSLLTPPNKLLAENTNGEKITDKKWSILILIPVLILLFWYLRKRKLQVKPLTTSLNKLEIEAPVVERITFLDSEKGNFEMCDQKTDKIRFFGGFEVINKEGEDITGHFTPLLKEMFLYLILNSIRWGKGLNSSKLDEMFWSDKDKASARNNRSVNIIKLKNLLSNVNGIEISKSSGNWKIEFDSKLIFIDYAVYRQIVSNKKVINNQDIKCLTEIVQRGVFLPNQEFEWLDDFKSEISNNIIDAYLHYAEHLDIHSNAEEIIEIANNILLFDPVDETAMILKCKALHTLGKHSIAKSTFEKFVKEYEILYAEKFDKSFQEVVDNNH